MSVSGEKLNLLIMRDSGETKRYRVRRSFFHAFITIFLCFPIFTAIAVWGCYALWQDNVTLKEKISLTEQLNQEYFAKAERLSNLEDLLKRETEIESKLTQNIVATAPKTANTSNKSEEIAQTSHKGDATTSDPKEEATASTDKESPATKEGQEEVLMDDGPGHAEFAIIDEGIIMVENVVSRLVEPRRLRTSLDLRNPGTASLAGEVLCILSLASGDTVPLTLNPTNVGNYRIQRWKKAVLFADIAEEHDLFNAQIIIEVKDNTGKLLYRNIFAIEQ